MEIKKTVVPISLVLLFFCIALSPGINAKDPDNQHLLTVWMPGITENDYSVQMETTEDQFNEINDSVNEFSTLIEEVMDITSPRGPDITFSEWMELKASVLEIIDSIKIIVGDDFPEIDVEAFVENIILELLNPFKWFQRAAVLSVGRGVSWIPFYDYETFIGVMIRPIFITHTLGFTASYHINMFPFRMEYADRIGLYRLTTMLFNGLFINFGDVGFDKIISPVILIGKGYNILGADYP